MSKNIYRIGIDTRDLNLAKTGIRTVLEEIIGGLNEDNEIEVVEISPKPFSPPKTRIQKAYEHIKFFWWKEVLLPLKVKQLHCDALICNDYVVPYFMPKRVNAFPIFHGCNIWELPEHYNKYWRWMFTWMAVPAARKAKAIITVSNFSKNKLCEIFKFDRDKVKVIPLGPKRSLFAPQKLVDLDRFGINEEDEYLLHVGVIEKRKNLVRLIEAFAKINKGKFKLVLVGQKGPKIFLDDYDNVVKAISKHDLMDKVVLTGHVSDEELHTFYSRAKLYVFPSLYEGFGIPVIEAFHYGLPMAASNLGALPEVVGDGGALFDPENTSDISKKIQEILNSTSEQIEEFRERQKSILKKYRWEKTIEEIKKIILVD